MGGERGDPFFAAFAVAAQVGAGAELDVRAAQPGELGDAQAGLDGDEQQGVVAAADPGGRSGAASSASTSSRVRNDTSWSVGARLAGMASTRWMSAACSG